jgi:hypothetical protein
MCEMDIGELGVFLVEREVRSVVGGAGEEDAVLGGCGCGELEGCDCVWCYVFVGIGFEVGVAI